MMSGPAFVNYLDLRVDFCIPFQYLPRNTCMFLAALSLIPYENNFGNSPGISGLLRW